MIIWNGKGLLVIAAAIFGSLAVSTIFGLLHIDTSQKVMYILQGLLMTALSAFFNYLFTRYFISNKVKNYIDEDTGERIQIRDGSSLFFIPNRYWTWIIAIGGSVITFVSSNSL